MDCQLSSLKSHRPINERAIVSSCAYRKAQGRAVGRDDGQRGELSDTLCCSIGQKAPV